LDGVPPEQNLVLLDDVGVLPVVIVHMLQIEVVFCLGWYKLR
jgi:hypothetical protein